MTDAQKECSSFEELSEHIVRYLLKDTIAEIKRTPENKDGGYDIVAECNDGKTVRKLYFECKLRSENLNLRDIAANVIIAFNEGAAALVVFTNYNYTVQADENLRQFCRKAILNIKIIIGEEIKNLVFACDASVSESLFKLIEQKKSNRKTYDSLLQIDFSKINLHEQLLQKDIEYIVIPKCNFLSSHNQNKVLLAKNIIQQGGILAVTGFIGIGKHIFVASVLQEFTFVTIPIDAALHETQESLLMDILLNIWGIPTKKIIENFTIEHINTIIDKIGHKSNNVQTIDILRRLFGDTKIQGINNENYNILICNYILELSDLHRHTFKYLFYVAKLEFASTEITVLLKYFIKRLHQQQIPCIIIHDMAEYMGQRQFDLENSFKYLERFFVVELNIYTKEEALAYIHHCKPSISDYIAKLIINQVGVRQSNIAMFFSYLENNGISIEDYQRVSYEIQELSPNSVPAITSKVMGYYRNIHRRIFDTLFLLQGKVAEVVFIRLGVDVCILDQLIKENILIYHSEYYVCANTVVWEILNLWGIENNPILHRQAQSILQVCNDTNNQFLQVKAYLLKYIGRFDEALENLILYIKQLEDTRQFDTLLTCYDIAIDILRKMNNPSEQLFYIIKQIEILDVKKDLLGKKATLRLNDLKEMLKQYRYLNMPQYYNFAYDYFIAKQDFKKGTYDTNAGIGAITRHYYNNTMNQIYTDNTGDWLGRLCYQYAIRVKESMGNNVALDIFVKILNALPGSFTIWREYYSHLGCMCFYNAPEEAFLYYGKIIDAFANNTTLCALPFHEYIDRAICKLLVGDNTWAANLAQDALEICEANGVIDEWGRALNIKGCAFLSQGKTTQALCLFKESSEILKCSGYKLYCWRSQLNYIQLALDNEISDSELSKELIDAYQCFVSLFQSKMDIIASDNIQEIIKTREYHALLTIGLCLNRIQQPVNIDIFADFRLDDIKEMYQKDLQQLMYNPEIALPCSPYYKMGKIMLVG